MTPLVLKLVNNNKSLPVLTLPSEPITFVFYTEKKDGYNSPNDIVKTIGLSMYYLRVIYKWLYLRGRCTDTPKPILC